MGQAPEEELIFDGPFSSWEEAHDQSTGYAAPDILAKVLEATLRVKRGEVAYERDSVNFDQIEYSWPALSALMLAAAQDRGRLDVLDFGGSLGSSYFQNRKFLKLLSNVKWSIVEQEHYVTAGISYLQDEQLRFYKTVEDCLNENEPNVILLSGVLSYLKDPYGLLKELLTIRSKIVILDRLCYVKHSKIEIVNIQHVPETIYRASFPCRLFVENRLCSFIVNQGYQKIEDFEPVDDTDEAVAYMKGHVFGREDIIDVGHT